MPLEPLKNFKIKDVASVTLSDPGTTIKQLNFVSQTNKNAFCFKFMSEQSPIKYYFEITNQNETSLLLRYRISILDANGQKHYTRENEWNYKTGASPTYKEMAYIPFETYIEFLRNSNRSLKIRFEVDILDQVLKAPSTIDKFPDKIKISDDFGSFLESGKFSDMILSVGIKDFKVHKLILAARSEVFEVMFENKETKEIQENRIVIEDMSAEVCEEMLRHIYTGSIPQMSEYAFDLFVAADKYQLIKLKSICEKALQKLLDTNSVCSVLLIADGSNAVELKAKCIEFISKNMTDVMKTDGWKQISGKNDILIELLKIR